MFAIAQSIECFIFVYMFINFTFSILCLSSTFHNQEAIGIVSYELFYLMMQVDLVTYLPWKPIAFMMSELSSFHFQILSLWFHVHIAWGKTCLQTPSLVSELAAHVLRILGGISRQRVCYSSPSHIYFLRESKVFS